MTAPTKMPRGQDIYMYIYIVFEVSGFMHLRIRTNHLQL